MNYLRMLSLIICLLSVQMLKAQNNEITDLTNTYYGIKNAMVADDAATAAIQAKLFLKSIEAVSKSNLNNTQKRVWLEQKGKLITTSEIISKTADLEEQREQLNELSIALYTFLKSCSNLENTVYYQYCSMKEAYWLSNEKEIKNPYYGKKMLNCGSIEDTLN